MNIFKASKFNFPYKNIKFPGQHTQEKIFYATRSHPIVLYSRLTLATIVMFVLALLGAYFLIFISKFVSLTYFYPLPGLIWIAILLLIYLWIWITYHRTILIITIKRLTQFVFSTPFTHFQLSLNFDQVVDTAASQHSYFQSILKCGNLFARSSAGAQGDFLFQNIAYHQDLHNWLNKLLATPNHKYRPFVPHLKGKARQQFLKHHSV